MASPSIYGHPAAIGSLAHADHPARLAPCIELCALTDSDVVLHFSILLITHVRAQPLGGCCCAPHRDHSVWAASQRARPRSYAEAASSPLPSHPLSCR